MVGAELSVSIHDDRASFWCKPIFVRVAAYAGHAFDSEIERLGFETSAGEKGDEEGAQTAVYVERELLLHRETGKSGYIVDYSMWEVGR